MQTLMKIWGKPTAKVTDLRGVQHSALEIVTALTVSSLWRLLQF